MNQKENTPTPVQQEIVDNGLPPIKPVKTDSIKPIVTYVLIGVTVFVFVLQLLSALVFKFDWVMAWGIKSNVLIIDYKQYWRFITPVFLHSNPLASLSGMEMTAIMHIAFNMYALFRIGPFLEKLYGHWRFLMLYLLSGFGGVVFSFIFSDYNSIGASTAVFGLFGAQAIFFFLNKQLFKNNAKGALQQIVTLVIINFVIGLSPGIDNWGHLGGFVTGLACAFYAGPVIEIVDEISHYGLKDTRTNMRCALTALAIFLVLVLLLVMRIV